MNQITIIESIKPAKVCKTYSINAAGKIEKNVIANVIEGKAITEIVNTAQEMATLLDYITAKDNFVLCAGTWRGAPADEFTLIAEADLAKRLGRSIGDEQLAGVHEINGEFVAARLKRSIEPSNWILLDADNPPGIPPEWAAMSIAERLALWEPLLPGISKCERIELRGSSARVVNGSGSHKATHAWIRVSDPSKISLMKAHLGIEMVNKGLSFPFKKQSRLEPGRVVGIESRSVFDLAVFDTGRLVFCAKPEVQIDGYRADSAGVAIINEGNGELDIGWIKQPGQAALNQYKEKTGIQLDLQVKGGFLSVHSNGQLTLDSEITSKGATKPLSDWVSGMKPGDKLRCESPFRESVSEAAFIKIGDDGQPFIHDVGCGTTYHLQGAVKALEEDEAAWPDPVDFWSGTAIPEYVDGAFPGVISNLSNALYESYGFDRAYSSTAMLVLAASLIHDDFRLMARPGDRVWAESARLWAILVGAPSLKKTPVIQTVCSHLEDEIRHSREAYERAMSEYKKQLKTNPDAEPPVEKRYSINDATPEAMAKVLADNPGGLLLKLNESTSWFGGDSYKSGTSSQRDLTDKLELYDGGTKTIDRVSRPSITVRNWSVCLLGATQPDAIKNRLTQMADNGLLQRVMWINGANQYKELNDVIVDPNLIDEFGRVISLISYNRPADLIRYVSPSDEAYSIQKTVFARIKTLVRVLEADSPKLASHIGKWEGLFLRLMLTMHFIENPAGDTASIKVSERIAKMTEIFMFDLLLPHTVYFHEQLDNSGGSPLVKEMTGNVAKHILRNGWTEFTPGMLTEGAKAWRYKDETTKDHALTQLESFGWIKEAEVISAPGKRGRKATTRFLVNPGVHSKFSKKATEIRKAFSEIAAVLKPKNGGN